MKTTTTQKIPLTARQLEIVQLVWAGLKNRDIAARLGVSVKTVEAHRATVMVKYRTTNAAQLLRALWQDGVIQP